VRTVTRLRSWTIGSTRVVPQIEGAVARRARADIEVRVVLDAVDRRGLRVDHRPGRAHLRLDHLFQGIRTTAVLLQDLAELPGA